MCSKHILTELWQVDKTLVEGHEKAQKNRPTVWGEEQQLAADWLEKYTGLVLFTTMIGHC